MEVHKLRIKSFVKKASVKKVLNNSFIKICQKSSKIAVKNIIEILLKSYIRNSSKKKFCKKLYKTTRKLAQFLRLFLKSKWNIIVMKNLSKNLFINISSHPKYLCENYLRNCAKKIVEEIIQTIVVICTISKMNLPNFQKFFRKKIFFLNFWTILIAIFYMIFFHNLFHIYFTILAKNCCKILLAIFYKIVSTIFITFILRFCPQFSNYSIRKLRMYLFLHL